MIRIALNNSMLETKNICSGLENIEEMKTFRPTEAEFKKPLAYIEHLIRTQSILDFGCIKIIPPESFKPTLAFDMDSNQKLPTRYQVLQELGQGRAFKQNVSGRTFKEYIEIAKEMVDDGQCH